MTSKCLPHVQIDTEMIRKARAADLPSRSWCSIFQRQQASLWKVRTQPFCRPAIFLEAAFQGVAFRAISSPPRCKRAAPDSVNKDNINVWTPCKNLVQSSASHWQTNGHKTLRAQHYTVRLSCGCDMESHCVTSDFFES